MSISSSDLPLNDISKPFLAPATDAAIEWVRLDCESFTLLLPASEVVSLAAAKNLIAHENSTAKKMEKACGSIEFSGNMYPVFCFNKALTLLGSMTENHSSVVILREKNFCFGISCGSLEKWHAPKHKVYPVPPSMSSHKQPFTSFTIVEQHAMGFSSAELLHKLLCVHGVKLESGINTKVASQQRIG